MDVGVGAINSGDGSKPQPGDVVEIALPDGTFAYARVYNDATIGLYKKRSLTPHAPPLKCRDFVFFVGIYDDALRKCHIVGKDPFEPGEDAFPPAASVKDPISGTYSIYHRGQLVRASPEQCAGLEEAAVWELQHIVDRLMRISSGSGLWH